jgi:hypothetical protein
VSKEMDLDLIKQNSQVYLFSITLLWSFFSFLFYNLTLFLKSLSLQFLFICFCRWRELLLIESLKIAPEMLCQSI